MSYYGVISQTENTKAPVVVNITDEAGRFIGLFHASTRDEAKTKLFDLLKTLREGQEDGLGPLAIRDARQVDALITVHRAG
jgi:hypothetical protein